MKVADHIGSLRRDGELLAAAAERASPDAAVPTCPEWVTRDLVRHTGGVHRWAASIVGEPRTETWDVDLDDVVGTWPDDVELVGWFRDGHQRLVATLEAADPDLECWTFLKAPSPLAMWARRQAHETAIHRVDAELATGLAIGDVSPFDPSLAADGIDELLTRFVTRRSGRLRSDTPCTLDVIAMDTGDRWRLHIGPDPVVTSAGSGHDEPSACVVQGAAPDLYLALWNRRGLDGLAVDGDHDVIDLFLDRVHVRWS